MREEGGSAAGQQPWVPMQSVWVGHWRLVSQPFVGQLQVIHFVGQTPPVAPAASNNWLSVSLAIVSRFRVSFLCAFFMVFSFSGLAVVHRGYRR